MRIIDLSAPIGPSAPNAAPYERVEMSYTSHADGAAQVQALLGVPPDLLRHGEGWAIEEFTRLGTHSVTHIDAPWHYNSRIQGRPAATIDELPLEWFFSGGVVLDMTAKADGEKIDVHDVRAAVATIDRALRPLDIVLLRTGRDAFYGRADYSLRGCAVTPEATRWLYEQGVRVMGIDAWGWDGPLDRQAREAISRHEPGVFWAAHQCDLEYSQIERLVNLGALPASGFRVSCFPLKIRGGSAGPARVVAILAD
jgi:kynurenine formamidase